MKPFHLFLSAVICAGLTGCSATRTFTDIGLGAGGAALGAALSKNNPAAIAGGAAGGVLLSETLNYGINAEQQKAWRTGYEKGRSDAVKQQFWLYVDTQRAGNHPDHVRLYEVHLPEQTIDGVIFKPATKQLRIEE